MRQVAGVGVPVLMGLLLTTGAVWAQNGRALLERGSGLDVEAVTLEEGLRQLERSAGVAVAFSPDLLPPGERITCRCTGLSVRAALDRMLDGTDLRYVEGRTQILIAPGATVDPPSSAKGSIVGLVRDAESAAPVVGARIRLLGSDRVTLSGADGRFIVVGVAPGAYAAEASALGFGVASTTGIEVRGGATARVDLALERAPIPLEEIVVTPGAFGLFGEEITLIQQTMTREDIESIPSFGDDIFRTIKRLPGVASDDISTKLNVRGGRDRNLLVRLDGAELYEPYHLKDFDGLFGIVDVQALGGIDLPTGGFPVEYGDKTAGVFNMRTRNPPLDGARTQVGLSLSSVSFLSQGVFGGGDGQWLVSARRGYLDIVLALSGEDDDLSPQYWDVMTKVQYQLGRRHSLSAHVLHAVDDLRFRDIEGDGDEAEINSNWANSYAWGTWEAAWSNWLHSEVIVEAGRVTERRQGDGRSPGRNFGPEELVLDNDEVYRFLGLRQEWQAELSERALLKGGFDVRREVADYDYFDWSRTVVIAGDGRLSSITDTVSAELNPRSTQAGAFLAVKFRPVQRFTAEAGFRYDYQSHTKDADVAPRLLAALDLGPRTTLRASWGRYYQSHGVQELRVGDGEREFAPSELAEQLAAGIEHRFSGGLSARLEVYERSVDRPRPFFLNLERELEAFPSQEGDRARIVPTEGRSKGVELLLSRDVPRLSWSASYVISAAEDLVDGVWAPRTLDQRHVVALAAALRPSDSKWQFSMSWQYHTGWPTTRQTFAVDTATVMLDDGTTGTVFRLVQRFEGVHDIRLPAYQRLDLRFTRQIRFRRSTMELYLDVFNVLGRRNLKSFAYRVDFDGNTRILSTARHDGDDLLPRLPSLGFRWVF